MTEYWKSQARKFCEFCKCWITDNKPSIEFHERGKRHQENVKKKIESVKKISTKKEQQQKKEENDFKRMELGALKSLKKDLEKDPELATAYGITKEQMEKLMAEPSVPEPVKKQPAPKTQNKEKSKGKPTWNRRSEAASIAKKEEEMLPSMTEVEWYEGYSPEGHLYFWNPATSESVWERPTTGIIHPVSEDIKEQQKTQPEGVADVKEENNDEDNENIKKETEIKQELSDSDESSENTVSPVPAERIKTEIKQEAVNTEESQVCMESIDVKNIALPPPRFNPKQSFRTAYGGWSKVVQPKIELPELQLPKGGIADIEASLQTTLAPVVEYHEEPRKLKFKEKVVTLGKKSSGAPVAFKKRKIMAGNRRRRDDDED